MVVYKTDVTMVSKGEMVMNIIHVPEEIIGAIEEEVISGNILIILITNRMEPNQNSKEEIAEAAEEVTMAWIIANTEVIFKEVATAAEAITEAIKTEAMVATEEVTKVEAIADKIKFDKMIFMLCEHV